MSASNAVSAAATLAILGFLTSVITSLIVAITNRICLITIGVVLMLVMLRRFFKTCSIKDDGKRRWTNFWTGIFSAFGGVVLFFEDEDLWLQSSTLTIVVLFSLTAIAVSTVVSHFYLYITRCLI
jgi:uncharacterized membrane protein YfcA